MLEGLEWRLWLPEAWYNKGCIHRLASPLKGYSSIVINIGCEVGSAIEHCRQSLISMISLVLTAKAWEYVFTGVGLCVCMSVCVCVCL